MQVVESRQDQMTDSVTATQNGIFRDVLAEHRRTPSVYAGKIGYVLPMFGLDDDGEYLQPTGIFRVGGIDNIYETPLEVPEALSDLDTAMYYAVSGFAYDSSKKQLWMARGAAGLGLYDASSNKAKHGLYQLNLKTGVLDSAKSNYKWEDKKNPRIFDVKLHPETGDIWMATSKGLWKRSADGKVAKASTALDTSARVTGLWMGGDPLTIIAETSRMEKESMKGALWVLREGDKDGRRPIRDPEWRHIQNLFLRRRRGLPRRGMRTGCGCRHTGRFAADCRRRVCRNIPHCKYMCAKGPCRTPRFHRACSGAFRHRYIRSGSCPRRPSGS